MKKKHLKEKKRGFLKKVLNKATDYGGFIGSLGARIKGRNAEDILSAVKYQRGSGLSNKPDQPISDDVNLNRYADRLSREKIRDHKARLSQGKGVSKNPHLGGVRMSEVLAKLRKKNKN